MKVFEYEAEGELKTRIIDTFLKAGLVPALKLIRAELGCDLRTAKSVLEGYIKEMVAAIPPALLAYRIDSNDNLIRHDGRRDWLGKSRTY
jgi:hypothetical protein